MPNDAFLELLRAAALQFAAGSILVQWALFRSREKRPGRRSLLRALPYGLAPAFLALGVWVALVRPEAVWDILLGLEILLAFVLLELGLGALALRFGLRAVFLGLGWAYAAAVALVAPGGPGETLLAVTLLGAATLYLGLRPPGAGS